MLQSIRDVIEFYRAHPRDFVEDVLGAICVTAIAVGTMFLPLMFGG